MDPWGRPHARPGSGAEWIVTWDGWMLDVDVDGWMASGPAAKQSSRTKQTASKVVETKKHGKAIIRTRGGEDSARTT